MLSFSSSISILTWFVNGSRAQTRRPFHSQYSPLYLSDACMNAMAYIVRNSGADFVALQDSTVELAERIAVQEGANSGEGEDEGESEQQQTAKKGRSAGVELLERGLLNLPKYEWIGDEQLQRCSDDLSLTGSRSRSSCRWGPFVDTSEAVQHVGSQEQQSGVARGRKREWGCNCWVGKHGGALQWFRRCGSPWNVKRVHCENGFLNISVLRDASTKLGRSLRGESKHVQSLKLCNVDFSVLHGSQSISAHAQRTVDSSREYLLRTVAPDVVIGNTYHASLDGIVMPHTATTSGLSNNNEGATVRRERANEEERGRIRSSGIAAATTVEYVDAWLALGSPASGRYTTSSQLRRSLAPEEVWVLTGSTTRIHSISLVPGKERKKKGDEHVVAQKVDKLPSQCPSNSRGWGEVSSGNAVSRQGVEQRQVRGRWTRCLIRSDYEKRRKGTVHHDPRSGERNEPRGKIPLKKLSVQRISLLQNNSPFSEEEDVMMSDGNGTRMEDLLNLRGGEEMGKVELSVQCPVLVHLGVG